MSEENRSSDYFIGLLTKEEIINLVKSMLMLNECNGKQVYQLSKITIAKSGYAFGICQHDCGQRADARECIKKCLYLAGVEEEQINAIMRVLIDHAQKLSIDDLALINTVLSMPFSTDIINQFDVDYISIAVKYVKAVVMQSVEVIPCKQILTKPAIFLQLVDYHNQFHLSATGLLISFLNGEAINRSSIGPGLTARIDSTKINTGLLAEIRHFINEYTEYGINHRHDCIRRQHNIDSLTISNS